jgi:hypothetical protein
MASASSPAELAAADARADPETLSRGRTAAIWTLIALATLIGLLSVLATWVNRQLLDEDNFRATSTELIQDPEVRAAVSTYLVDSLYENVDVPAELRQSLPEDFKGLAGPLASALVRPTTIAVSRLLSRPRVQQLWIEASSRAHTRLVNVLEDNTGEGISTGDGTVTLDLRAIVMQVGQSLGLSGERLQRLPEDTGVIVVMKSDQLAAAQTGVKTIKVLSVWLGILALVLFGVAVYLARGHRREAIRAIGWAFIGVGVIALVARHTLGDWAVGSLVDDESRVAAQHVWAIGTSVLGDIGYALILYGLFGVVGTTLAGPTSTAIAARQRLNPFFNERPGVVWGAAALAFLLLVLWGGTHALRTWWGVLLLGALAAAGVWAFQRQAAQEQPVVESPALPAA